jgi:hypothetical protein
MSEIVTPPNTRLVLFTRELMKELADGGRVEWGEPSPEGWYVPTIYADPRLVNSQREVTVLEEELRLAKAEREDMSAMLIRLRDFVGDLDPAMLDAFVFNENNRARGNIG